MESSFEIADADYTLSKTVPQCGVTVPLAKQVGGLAEIAPVRETPISYDINGEQCESRDVEARCAVSASDLLSWARVDLFRLAEQPQAFEATLHFIAEHGLDWVEIEACAGMLSVVPVRFDGDSFEFGGGEEGEPAVVVEVLAEDGETVIDLAAWRVAQPDCVGTMFGRAPALGIAAARNPATFILGRPLPVLRSGLDWLKSGGLAFVVLDPVEGVRALREVIERGHRIASQGVPHAFELRNRIEGLFEAQRIVCASETTGAL